MTENVTEVGVGDGCEGRVWNDRHCSAVSIVMHIMTIMTYQSPALDCGVIRNMSVVIAETSISSSVLKATREQDVNRRENLS